MKSSVWVSLLSLEPFSPLAVADVADSSSTGFTLKATIVIQATADDVYGRIIHHVGDWWNASHTFSGDAQNLSIEEKPMGCFCEKLPNRGSMRIQPSPSEGGTKLELVYAVGGYLPAGLNTWAAPVDSVVTEQFTRLKNCIERGDPAATPDAVQRP